MEQELVGSSCSVKESSREVTLFSYLQEICPYFMHYGMTYEQFWYEDCELANYYQKMYEIKRAEENQKLWLQGAYFYIALCDVAPLYSLKPRSPEKYLSEPFPLSDKEARERDEREQGERLAEYMNTFMANFNKKEGEKNA